MAGKKENEFVKTKELTPEEFRDIVNTDFGVQAKLQDVKAGSHVIMKILEPLEIDHYEHAGDMKTTYKLKCHYKGKGYEGFDLTVQIGEGAAKRLDEKFPEDSYVNKYAFFSRTSYEGKYPQFVNPMKKYEEPRDKSDLFKKKEEKTEDKALQDGSEGAKSLNLEGFDAFKAKYLEAVKKNGSKANAVHMLGSYIATYEKKRVAKLIELCTKAIPSE